MPLIIVALPLLGAALVWLLPSRSGRWLLPGLAAIQTAVAVVIAVLAYRTHVIHSPGEWVRVDSLSVWMVLAISAASWPVLIHTAGSTHLANDRPFLSWLLALLASMYLVVITGNMGLMWVAVEATTLCSTLLVAQHGDRAALEAAWKYVLICSVGITFALLGTIVLYFASSRVGVHQLDWSSLVAAGPRLSRQLMRLAFVFALVGYGAKAGLAPMHSWLPDAHSQAPAPVSALLSGILLGCATYALSRVFTLTSLAGEGVFAGNLLIAMGILSLLVAVPFMVAQTDLKRLLAYSSVEHSGIIALGLGFGGPAGIAAALLHLMNHALVKPALFLTAGDITEAYGSRKIARIRGLMTLMPRYGSILLVLVAAIAGLPPFGLFLSELRVFQSGLLRLGWFIPGVALGLLVLMFAGLFYHTSRMLFGPPKGRIPEFRSPRLTGWAVALPLALVIMLGVLVPAGLQRLLNAAAHVVMTGVLR